ncbi:MAG: hypothetical protein J6N72_02630 [Psychrobacter sp.]|nr:hypothetical protein [Psychrobacter sp.]
MQAFDLATQDFLNNHIGQMNRELAIALISQFGGEDALMNAYVMALPNNIEIESVPAFMDDKLLVGLYTEHKEAIISIGWRYAAEQGYNYPLDLYVELGGLGELTEGQVKEGMHNENSHLHTMVAGEIVRFMSNQLCIAWCAFNKKQDDLGEQVFNMYHS